MAAARVLHKLSNQLIVENYNKNKQKMVLTERTNTTLETENGRIN